jgi:hypothetical protein
MPSVSKAQHNFMSVCHHNPKHARGKCPPPRVSEEFVEADAARKEHPQKAAIRELARGRK